MRAILFGSALSILLLLTSGLVQAAPAPAASGTSAACPENSSPERQLELAVRLADDKSAENDAIARQCFSSAAESGVTSAQVDLGIFLFQGRGGPRDVAAAREWLDRAAKAGSADGARV